MDLVVSTFRTRKLAQSSTFPETVLDRADEKQQKIPPASNRMNSISNKHDHRKSVRNSMGVKSERPSFLAAAANKLEARKAARNSRMITYKDLMKTKPDDKYEDPKDVAAINYAQNNMGDYKLKTSDDYIVPEHERVDADKKKRQINLLSEGVHILKEVSFALLKHSNLISKF
jgi:hypothetical protein